MCRVVTAICGPILVIDSGPLVIDTVFQQSPV